MTKKLKAMPYAQAHVCIEDDDSINLVSYTVLICKIDADGWLYVRGLCSQTTRRHISAFMREYGNGATYCIAKWCYENNCIYNIYTGECKELEG